jgi:CBS domain-containing protein
MLVRDLIKDSVPPLKTTDSAARALLWMQEFRHSHFPVIGANGFMGMVHEVDLMKVEKRDAPLLSLSVPFTRLFVNEHMHLFDAIKFAANNEFTLVPVLNDREQYLGCISLIEILQAIAESNSVQNPGGIVVLGVERDRYNLSEICRIVESEGAQVLSSSATVTNDPDSIEVTLKVNRIDLTRILAGFYRNGMDVKASYHQSEFQQDLQTRYDAFMNYLKM